MCCLRSSFPCANVHHSVLVVLSFILARRDECRPTICSSFPGSVHPAPHSTLALILSFTRCFRSLDAFIHALPVKVLSKIVVIRSRQYRCCVVLSLFRAMRALHNLDAGIT